MERKSHKITFESINSKWEYIDPKKIHEANERIKKEMKPFIRKHKKNMHQSMVAASKLVVR